MIDVVRLSVYVLKTFLLLICISLLAFPQQKKKKIQKINPKDVTIVRDEWGVPHIYGKTDADAAYGLAYAHCEDAFKTVQEAILAINGRLSEVQGKGGAVLDVLGALLDADPILDKEFENLFSPQFKKVLAAGSQGFNDYAKSHPKEIIAKNIFPVSEKELVKGYILAQGILSSAAFGMGRVFDGKMESYQPPAMTAGSNGFAFRSDKTKEGKTVLVSNTHQPLEGIFSWYECHVVSEEGWNFLGATFSAGLTPFIGTNENLGWTHTTNYPDLHDVYELTTRKNKGKLEYLFDDKWYELKKQKIKLKVKVGFLKIPVTLKYYRSKYGTAVKNKDGYFAVRMSCRYTLKAPEQWYQMTKASNLEEFKEAIKLQGVGTQNIIYADKEDNIFFMCNGAFPYRNPNYNWKKIVPGNTSKTLWEPKFHPIKDLPQLLNPDCGYIYNSNNRPFSSTCEAECPKPEDYDPTMGFLQYETNRGLRIQELMEKHEGEQLSYTDIKTIKYDTRYTENFYTHVMSNLNDIIHIDRNKYPDLKDAMKVFHKWDRRSNIENKQASLACITVYKVLKYLEGKMAWDLTNTIPEEEFVKAIRYAKKYLLKHYGTLEVELGKVQRHIKGDVSLPVAGLPDHLAAMFSAPYKKQKGIFKAHMGETYIQFVQYSKDGVELIETIHPFGASEREDSPHYTDQMELFTQQKLKKMTLDKETIFKNAKRIYHPGE